MPRMKRLPHLFWIILPLAALLSCGTQGKQGQKAFVSADDVRPASYAGKTPRFHALYYYSNAVEEAHIYF